MEQKDKFYIDKKNTEGIIKNLDQQIVFATKKVVKRLAKSLCGSLVMVASWVLLSLNFPNLSPKVVEYIQAGLIASTSISTFYTVQQLLSPGSAAKKLCNLSSQKEKLAEVSLQHAENYKQDKEIKEEFEF